MGSNVVPHRFGTFRDALRYGFRASRYYADYFTVWSVFRVYPRTDRRK
jgi:hypothetical protein